MVHTAKGLLRYEFEVAHYELHKYQLVRDADRGAATSRARAKAAEWDEAWEKRVVAEQRRLDREATAQDTADLKELAAEHTREAQEALHDLSTLLPRALGTNPRVNWESLKGHDPYPVPKPVRPLPPSPPAKHPYPREPQATDPEFKSKYGVLDHLIASRYQARVAEAYEAFTGAHEAWTGQVDVIERQHTVDVTQHGQMLREQEELYAAALDQWNIDEAAYLEQQRQLHLVVDRRREKYESGDPDALTDYCEMVLDRSDYPDCFPQDFEIEYSSAGKTLIVDYQLPAPTDLPSVVETRYIVARNELVEKAMPQRTRNQLYDSVLYQVALRTLYELFEADGIEALSLVTFNGWVKSVDQATGRPSESCVLSIQVARDEFASLRLGDVDPKACFKKLKGVSAAKLYGLVPVAPLLSMSREDRRFVSSYGVADTLTQGDNLAAMDWEDFEHLIRELFEKEFCGPDAEVRVTQASRDGGVDAVVFDPDPLHGGKTVVQAKRYTNTVGVSAVRDLYGTLMNEGANKGVLVTTSDYGPDAYEFARGKPLVLLNGGNLLHLLAKHGHAARIDIQEAKLLAD